MHTNQVHFVARERFPEGSVFDRLLHKINFIRNRLGPEDFTHSSFFGSTTHLVIQYTLGLSQA